MLINPFMVAPSIPASTRILMPFTTASGFTDVANNHAITVVGSPTITALGGVFDNGALLVSSAAYVRVNSTSTLDLSAKTPFTLECYVYITGGTGASGFLSMRNSGSYVPIVANAQYSLIGNSALNNWATLAGTIPLNTKMHVAIVGDGTNIKIYIGGALTGTTAHPSWTSTNRFLNVGYDFSGSMTGYISSLRFSDIAVYTANFTPPSAF